MKLLGMIGGTSWHSTIVYYRMINEQAGQQIGLQANPPLLLYSLNIELMRSQDWERIKSSYLEIALKLQHAGCQGIIICANTPHVVYEYVQLRLDIPILHIADAVGLQAQSLGLGTLGLLGNKPTMTKGFISGFLKDHYDIRTLIPGEHDIPKAHHYVSAELTQGKFTDEARTFFREQMEFLKSQGAEGIILGCTELPLLMEQDVFDLPLLATTQLHVARAVEFILSDRQD
jgi:aspartate racemase